MSPEEQEQSNPSHDHVAKAAGKNKHNYIFSDTNMTKMDQICHLASMDRPLLNSTLY